MALTPSWPGPSGLATTTDGRKALAGMLVKSAAGAARAGVFPRHANALVAARGDMNVDIGIFEGAAVQFGGPILLANDAVAQLPSPLVSPGAGITNYYVVYAKQNESTSPGTDANINRVFGAQLSTTSFAAARATLPTGAVELATVQMPTGKTATNQGSVVITPTFQYTAAAGGVVWCRDSTELAAWTPADGALAYQMDTGTFYRRTSGSWTVAWEDTGWAPLTLAASWVDFGGSYGTAQFRRLNGVVYLAGLIKNGTVTAGTVIATLPAGFRPSSQEIYVVGNGGVGQTIQIATNGQISLGAGIVNSSLSLTGVRFPVG